MKPREFKAEMAQLVANAQEVKKGIYRAEVNGRKYEWRDMLPEVFAQEQIKRFNSQTRQINKMSFKADESRIMAHQKMLVWLWNNKDKWQALINLRDKYQEHRESIKDYKYKWTWKKLSTDWNSPEIKKIRGLITKMEYETKAITGSATDIFDLCDTIPYNWLAMA